MLELNDLLVKASISPERTIVFRHRPMEPALRNVFPWIASEKRDLFNAFQRNHAPRVENALKKAEFVASFVGIEAGEAVFAGIYRNDGFQDVNYEEFWAIQENAELRELGMGGFQGDRENVAWFDLINLPHYSEWNGKLVVRWPGLERSWWRWADRNHMQVDVIAEENLLVPSVPTAEDLVLNWRELKVIPGSWKNAIGQWRGVYLITDTIDGSAYVGSAYGVENIYGRWMNYAETGHGENVLLRARDPEGFRFSILQLVVPGLGADEVIRLEARWKDRLLTREFGLNAN